MEFYIPSQSTIGFREIHPLVAELVRQIPTVTDPTNVSAEAEDRLYPSPTSDHDLDDLRSDWKAYVAPELHSHFQTSREIVSSDLRRLKEIDEAFELTIPRKHIEAWLNVLNQARLALAASINFNERLLGSNRAPDLLSEEGLIVFRINLYATIQQYLVDLIDDEDLPA